MNEINFQQNTEFVEKFIIIKKVYQKWPENGAVFISGRISCSLNFEYCTSAL